MTENTSLTIFLSHAHVDSDVAEVIDDTISDTFLGLLKVFRSSAQEGSIEIGDSIKTKIKSSLSGSVAAITLLSHSSMNRPWINIEFGALWMLDTIIIPVCFPDLKTDALPFHFSDTKVCSLGSEDDCVALIRRLLGLIKQKFPFDLKERDITRHGRSLYKKVEDAIRARLSPSYDEPPLPDRTTIWVIGSYSELSERELGVAKRLVPILAKGLVDLRVRLVTGESDMLLELSHHYRDAAIAANSPVPTAIMLSGKLRQRDLKNLFLDAIGVIPDLAIVIGGRVSRGRVEEECVMADKAGIPLLPIPATGGVAAKIQRTADKVDDLHSHLANTGEAVDTGDLSNAVLKAVRKYIRE